MAIEAVPLHDLILKGTHNSYACRATRTPCMNHPPNIQIDDFGVWHIELDFSVVIERGGPVPVVGHHGPGDASCWGYYLTDYLRLVKRTRSLAYRPVFVCFEVKDWRRSWRTPWHAPGDGRFSYWDRLHCGLDAMREVCGDRAVNLEDLLKANDFVWPTVPELAGKVVFHAPNRRDEQGRLLGLRATFSGGCVSPEQVEAAIEQGHLFVEGAPVDPEGFRALRLDQYQADWTFEYGVPPNPIVVDANAPAFTTVTDSEGMRWHCGSDASHGQQVGEHGTFRFPYRTIAAAMRRACGFTERTGEVADPRRAGRDWTILIRPGHYDENRVELDFPLRFERDGSVSGEVTFSSANQHLERLLHSSEQL